MGIIKRNGVHDNKMYVTNWRLMTRTIDNEIILTLSNLSTFIISDITPKEINMINEHKLTEEKHFFFSHVSLACNKCKGIGKLDWISIINGTSYKGVASKGIFNSYRRNPNTTKKINKKDHGEKFKENYGAIETFISQPFLKDGEEVCDKCLGSGAIINSLMR